MAAAWAVALACGVIAYSTAELAWRKVPRPRPLEELTYYPSGEHLKLATLGHAETAADLAWLRAVQYYGEHRRTDLKFAKLDHVFGILTSLSPQFVPAYVFGAFALAQEGRQFDQGVALMQKGLEANPTSGLLAFELGFLYYVRPGGRDLEHAAEYFEQASRQPDAPAPSKRFAAFVRQHAGDLRLAWELWRDVAEHSTNPYLRDMAEREMHRIEQAIATGRTDLARGRLSTPSVLIKDGR
jgi:hypothetical protein